MFLAFSFIRRYRSLVPPICLVAIAFILLGVTDFTRAQHGITTNDTSGQYFGEPIPNLSAEALKEYEAGFDLFIKVWVQAEGLGPLFNAKSCVACHRIPLPGGSGTTRDTFVLHAPELLDIVGGTSFSLFRVGKDGQVAGRTPPLRTSSRKTQPLFGLGLLEAVPDEFLLEYSDPEDRDGDGISGRLAKVGQQYGRFGWKGTVSTIERFVEKAFASEMGLATPSVPNKQHSRLAASSASRSIEVSEEQVHLVSQFIRFLAPPPSPRLDQVSLNGQEIFMRIDCAKCHRPALQTGGKNNNGLGGATIYAYTDLLVHNMGKSLADGIKEGSTSEQEFRTPPLWGLTFTGPPYLHDGRATTIEQAIEAHDGEARLSALSYRMLTRNDRESLIRFLKSL